MFCPNLSNPEIAKKFNELLAVAPEHAYYLWNKYEGEVPAKYYNVLQRPISAGRQYQNIPSMSTAEIVASENTLRDLAARMANRIGLPYRMISDRNEKFKGKIENGEAIINLAYASLDTPIHEILGHPIIRAIKDNVTKYDFEFGGIEDPKHYILENGKRIKSFVTGYEALIYIKDIPKQESQLYQNLLKELEYGVGKEVLDRIKRDYVTKDYIDANNKKNYEYTIAAYLEEEIGERYTLKEQQEEAIVELLGLMTAEKLDNVKEGKLISLLRRLLKEMKLFMRQLLGLKEVEINNLPDNMTLGDLSDLLAYSNSKLILPGNEVIYTTPDNQHFKTYGEASKHISDLAKSVEDVDLSNITLGTELTEAEKEKIKDLEQEIQDLKKLYNSAEYKAENKEKLQTLEAKKALFLNTEIVFKGQESNLNLEDKKKYEFNNFAYTRVYNTEGIREGDHKKTLGDYSGYYIFGYNVEEEDQEKVTDSKILKITKEEAEEVWKKAVLVDPEDSLGYLDRKRLSLLNKSIHNLKKGNKEKYAIQELEYKIDKIKEGNTRGISGFIEKNKEYEQAKEIIEEWKKVNNIQYNPEEIYSRGQEFVSVVGAYSSFDVNLMMQNLLQHIEDNKKAGGKFAISAYTKPIDRQIGHLEGGGGKIKFKLYPQSNDILWAANADVYSGSVWDASTTISKDTKSELLGVSYSKYPSLSTILSVQPNLAFIVDELNHNHNELGISLTGSNFRLEYDDDIPYSTKKIINSVNSTLDQNYGKVVKPKIEKSNIKNKYVLYIPSLGGSIPKYFDTLEKAEEDYNSRKQLQHSIQPPKLVELIGIQPTQTNQNTKSISMVMGTMDLGTVEGTPDFIDAEITKEEYESNITSRTDEEFRGLPKDIEPFKEHAIFEGNYYRYFDKEGNPYFRTVEGNGNSYTKRILKKEKQYTNQAIVNTKIAKLKEVAKKYPRSLIRSEVKPTDTNNYSSSSSKDFGDDLPFQKIRGEVKPGVSELFDSRPGNKMDARKKRPQPQKPIPTPKQIIQKYLEQEIVSDFVQNITSDSRFQELLKTNDLSGIHALLKSEIIAAEQQRMSTRYSVQVHGDRMYHRSPKKVGKIFTSNDVLKYSRSTAAEINKRYSIFGTKQIAWTRETVDEGTFVEILVTPGFVYNFIDLAHAIKQKDLYAEIEAIQLAEELEMHKEAFQNNMASGNYMIVDGEVVIYDGRYAERRIAEKRMLEENNVEQYIPLLNHLLSRFPGVTYRFDNTWPKAATIDLVTGEIIFNPYYMTSETAWHEFGHIIVRGIKIQNPKLFQALKKQVQDLDKKNPGSSALREVREAYPDYIDEYFWEEVITTELGRQADKIANADSETSIWQPVYNFFNNLLYDLRMYGVGDSLGMLSKRLAASGEVFQLPSSPEGMGAYMDSRLLTPEQQDALATYVKRDDSDPEGFQTAAQQIKMITEAITTQDMARIVERNKYFVSEEVKNSEALKQAGDILRRNKGRLVAVLTKEDVAESVMDFVEYAKYITIYMTSLQRHITILQTATDVAPGQKLKEYHSAYLQALTVKKQIEALMGNISNPEKGVFTPQLKTAVEQAQNNANILKDHPIAKALFWAQQSINSIILNHVELIQEPVLQELSEHLELSTAKLKMSYSQDVENFIQKVQDSDLNIVGQTPKSKPTHSPVASAKFNKNGIDTTVTVRFTDRSVKEYSLIEYLKEFSTPSKAVTQVLVRIAKVQVEFNENAPTKENIRKHLANPEYSGFAAFDTAVTTKNAGINIIASYLQSIDTQYRSSLLPLRDRLEEVADLIYDAQAGPTGTILDSREFYRGMYREQPLYEIQDGKLAKDRMVLVLNNSTDTVALRNRMTELKHIIDYSGEELLDLEPNDFSPEAEARRTEVENRIKQASEDLRDFLSTYTERPYKDEYYEIQSELPQDIRDRRNELYQLMAAARTSFVGTTEIDYEDFQALISYQKELDDMESFWDVNGNRKPESSESYRVAKAITDWKRLKKQVELIIYETPSKETLALFNTNLNTRKQELVSALASATTEDQRQDAESRYSRWLDTFTRTTYSDDFYEERQTIINKIAKLSPRGAELTEAYDNLFSLLLGKKDRNGQYRASDLTDGVRQTAKELETIIDEIRASAPKLSRTQDQADEAHSLYQQLDALQESLPTRYYVDVVNNIKASLRTLTSTEFPDKTAAEIEDIVVTRFKESDWYKANHIKRDRWNDELQRYVTRTEPLFFWRVTVPRDSSYINNESPNFYWSTPKVNPEFKNDKYVAGETIFKPVTSGPYYNSEYANLSPEQKTALEEMRKLYQDSQKGNYAQNRLGDVLPGVVKTVGEYAVNMNERGNLKGIWMETKAFFLGKRSAMPDAEDETLMEESLDAYGDPIQRQSRRLFMRFSKPLPLEEQSYDLLRNIALYAESSARLKSLKAMQSTVLAMEDVYENLSGIREAGVVKDLIDRQFYGANLATPKSKAGRVANTFAMQVTKFAGAKTLAYNIISAPVNHFTGYKNNAVFTKANGLDYQNGIAALRATMGLAYDFFTSYNQTGKKTKRMQIIEFFAGTQGSYSQDFTDITNRGLRKHSKLWRAVSTYRDFTEYDISAQIVFAYLDKYSITAADGSIYKLADAFEQIGGKLQIRAGVEFSPKFLDLVKAEIKTASFRSQGVYDRLAQPTASKHVFIRMVLFLKKWLPMHAKTEWGGDTIYYGSGTRTIGTNRAFLKFMTETFKEYGRFWKGYKSLTVPERAALQQFGLNYSAFVVLSNLVSYMGLMSNCEEDGKQDWKDYACFFLKKVTNEVEGVFTIWGMNEFLFTYIREQANGIGAWEKLGWALFGPFSVYRKFWDLSSNLYSTDPYYKHRPNSKKIDWDRTHPAYAGRPGVQVLAMEMLGAKGFSLGLDAVSMEYMNRSYNDFMPKTYTKDLRTRYTENYGGLETPKSRTVMAELKTEFLKQNREIDRKMIDYTADKQEIPKRLYDKKQDLLERYQKAYIEIQARGGKPNFEPKLFRPFISDRPGLDIKETF